MFTVLVLGAGGNAGINFIKSLRKGMSDFRIIGCDIDKYNLVSSNADERVLLHKTGADKVDEVLGLTKKHNVDFVHAQPDPEVRFLLENKAAFANLIFDHDLEVWHRFAHKLDSQRAWNQKLALGFKSHSLSALEAEPGLFPELLSGSGKAWIRAIRGAGSRAALPVTSLAQATTWAQYWIEMRGMHKDDFMVAEFLSGREYAVQTLFLRGELVHSQARCRLVYFFGSIMPSGQSSTPAVAVTVDERDVYDTAYAAIKAIDPSPHGIYCVDMKRNAKGAVIPMEVNYGRFFTTSDFFASIGVNTPVAVIDAFRGRPVARMVEAIKKPFVWIRGLDKEPMLVEESALP